MLADQRHVCPLSPRIIRIPDRSGGLSVGGAMVRFGAIIRWRGGGVNAVSYERDSVDPEEWDRPEMRTALAARDITRIYRLLQKAGFSQQRIAALTGQSQPEVSAIIHGRRVMAYDVLSRIADGLGVPREYMGLAFEAMPAGAGGESSSGRPLPGAASEEDDPVQRRDFLGATVAVLGGANALAYERWLPRTAAHAAPPPARIGASDVARIRRT